MQVQYLSLLLLSFFSYTYSIFGIFGPYEFTINVKNCPNFLHDTFKLESCLVTGCAKAHIESVKNNIVFDGNTFSIYGIKGHVILTVDSKSNSCKIQFYCDDESYNFNLFLQELLKHIEKCDNPVIEVTGD